MELKSHVVVDGLDGRGEIVKEACKKAIDDINAAYRKAVTELYKGIVPDDKLEEFEERLEKYTRAGAEFKFYVDDGIDDLVYELTGKTSGESSTAD